MDAHDVIEPLTIAGWHGPFDPALQARAVDALEAGRVLLLANLPFRLVPDETFLLSPAVMGSERKNISFDLATGTVGNTSLTGADADRLRAMLRRFGDAAEALLRDLLPGYAPALERARTSFRPAEIAGRDYSPRHDDRLLHVDAFPSRPMRGRRILRLFSNIAPDGAPRAWRVGEPFPDFARQFLRDPPMRRAAGRRLAVAAPGRHQGAAQRLRPHHAAAARQRKARRQLPVRRAAGRPGVRRRHHLAVLHRSGAARRARRTLRAGADVSPADCRDGAS